MPLRFNVAMLFAIFWVIIFNLSAVNCVWYNKSFNQSTPLLYFSSSTYQHKKNSGCFYKSTESYSRVHKITYEFGGPSEKKMSVLINILLQNINRVSVLSKICPNFVGHVWLEWRISWTLLLLSVEPMTQTIVKFRQNSSNYHWYAF
jgi:hypothetical protein